MRRNYNHRLREWVDVEGNEYPDFEQEGYYCYSFYSKRKGSNTSFCVLEDSLETYDYDEAESWIWEHLQDGCYCELETPDGTMYFDPDKVDYGNDAYGIEDYQVFNESFHRPLNRRRLK